MFAQLFGRRRQRPPEQDNSGPDEPPTKKIKPAGHKDETEEETDSDNAVVLAVLLDLCFLKLITSFLDYQSELHLAASCRDLHNFFHDRALRTLHSIMPRTPHERNAFLGRLVMSAIDALPEDQQHILINHGAAPSFWTSIWSWLRGQSPPPTSHRQCFRFYLRHAYRVPLVRQDAFRSALGPSCSSSSSSRPADEQRLFCLAGGHTNRGGLVVTLAVTEAASHVVSVERTRQSDPGEISHQPYSSIMDKLWHCSSPDNNNNQNKGFLILKHKVHFSQVGGEGVRVLDLSQTNQDVGLGPSNTGIDQRPIMPSGAFRDAFPKEAVVVSEHDALVFFVGNRNGRIGIESHDVTTGQLVASARKQVGAVGPGSPENLLMALNSLYPCTRGVVTGGKLVVTYHTENDVPVPGEVNDYGFGIFVWNCHDLSFCSYVPMFGAAIYLSSITKDWIVYSIPRTPGDFVLHIAGGKIGQARMINLDNNIVLATENHVYACNPNKMEGNIEIDQFDVLTGNNIRTLETGIPCMVDDDETGHRLRRRMANAHVVGNKVVFLISSVGSHINTIVAFALPPP